jgi:glycosyltransferase involved in cell wall biosynthesis
MSTVEWPRVAIVICTFRREREIRLTIESLLKNLRYPSFAWYIADDGSGGDYVNDVALYIRSHDAASPITYTITDREGWGANVNAAMYRVEESFIYFTEDDYLLLRELDLRPFVALLQQYEWMGLVRFGIAAHGFICKLHECDISQMCPDYNESSIDGPPHMGMMNVWEVSRVLPGGPGSFYRYSNRPHLKHKRFHGHYGLYPTGRSLGRTEEGMNGIIAEADGGPAIVCPAEWVGWHYDHIGHSRQGSE